ncbi:MAG: hypothetical protein N2037_13420 [Acidimicrobiales bacterium]|nr:hypothetical protein [Acidimicrobiales bacterium]
MDECRADHNARLAAAQTRWPNLWVLPTDLIFSNAWGDNGTPRCVSVGAFWQLVPKVLGDTDPVTPGIQSQCMASDNVHFEPNAAAGLGVAYTRVLMWIFNNNLAPCPLDAVARDLNAMLTSGLNMPGLTSGPGCP